MSIEVADPLGSQATGRPPLPAERPAASAVARRSDLAWMVGALGLTLLFALRAMAPALGDAPVVQGDAREHVFWLVRLRDPELFRDDLIADYFQSVAPPGFVAIYWALSWLTTPLQVSKLLPLALGQVAALFAFLLARRLHPSPVAAFLASALLSWYVWQYDDLASGTARSFLLPTLAVLLWALVSDRPKLAVAMVVLAGLLYPVAGALGVALLAVRTIELQGRRPRLSRDRRSWLMLLVAGGLTLAVLLPTQLGGSRFGPIVPAAQARRMPEFGPDGRKPYFVEDPYRFWIVSVRSGLDARITDPLLGGMPILFQYTILAALLPLLLLLRRRIPAATLVSVRSTVLLEWLVAAFGLFFLAHLLLFRLYLPSRYVKLGLPLVLAVAAGLALGILAETLAARAPGRYRALLVAALAVGLALFLTVRPGRYDGNFTPNPNPALSEYLRSLPKDTLIAGVPNEADQIPTFASRSVLATREYSSPYHLGYYGEMRRRLEDLIDAYYAESPRAVADFAERYGVDLLLVNRTAFNPARFHSAWNMARNERPFAPTVADKLDRRRFALLELAERCAEFDDGEVAAVPTRCILSAR